MPSSNRDRSFRQHLRTVQRTPAARAIKELLRNVRQLGPMIYRTLTSNRRALPSVVIVGAQKAGTTQLYASMVRHPKCFGSLKKEVQYFSKQPHKSLAWYRSHFDLKRTIHAVGGIALEATPSYLPSPAALSRMHAVVPQANVIVLVRDPVSRAFSHYQHYKTRGREHRSFAVAVDEILGSRTDSFAADWLSASSPEPLYDYVARGYYALQLETLWRLYGRDQILVMDSSELFADTDAATQRVFEFVGLEYYPVPPKKVLNRGHYRERIDTEVAQLLREHYRSHDEHLAQLLGRPLSWMQSAGSRAA